MINRILNWLRQDKVRLYCSGLFFDIFFSYYEIEGLKFKVPKSLTDRKFRGRFLLGKYETDIERIYIHKYLHSSARVLELGACLGVHSCIINRILIDPTQHVAVDAHPDVISHLKSNRAINGAKFHISNSIVSHEPEVEFHIHDLIVGGSAQRATYRQVTVQGASISELESEFDIKFDTLFVDIEGGEYELFKQHADELCDIQTIFFEWHNRDDFVDIPHIAECPGLLRRLGYELVDEDSTRMQQVWQRP